MDDSVDDSVDGSVDGSEHDPAHGGLLALIDEAYDLGRVRLDAGPRGANGRIWRLTTERGTYALKEGWRDPPTPDAVEVEVAFTRRAAERGVGLAASHPDRHGRHVVEAPGAWLRLYDWVDVSPVDLSTRAADVGTMLARLHLAAPRTDRESDGSPATGWYDAAPSIEAWPALVARASGARWAEDLAALVARLPATYAVLSPADPRAMLLCHRDLHPENVLADPSGSLVVVDWDELGPADPGRELATVLLNCFHDGVPDLEAMAVAHRAYVEAGGPGRVTTPSDLTMRLAGMLNFLRRQVEVALDPASGADDRAWAEHEIDEVVRVLPTPEVVEQVLDATR